MTRMSGHNQIRRCFSAAQPAAFLLLLILVGFPAQIGLWAQNESPEAYARISKQLRDPNIYARIAAVKELSYRSKKSIPYLTALLTDSVPQIREAAAESLTLHPEFTNRDVGTLDKAEEAAVLALINALEDTGSGLALRATQALNSVGPAAIPYLIRTMNDPQSPMDLRLLAMNTLDLGFLDATLSKNFAEVSERAKIALPGVLQGLGDRNHQIHKDAFKILGHMGKDAKNAIPALVDILNRELDIEKTGTGKGQPLSNTESVPGSAKPSTLTAFDLEDAREAAKVIRTSGSDAKSAAIPALLRSIESRDEELRFQAALALATLGPPSHSATRTVISELVAGIQRGNGLDPDYASESLRQLSLALQDSQATDMIQPLSTARIALVSVKHPNTEQDAETIRRTVEYLESLWWKRVFDLMVAHPLVWAAIGLDSLCFSVWLILLWIRPLSLFHINEALRSGLTFKLKLFGGAIETELPIRSVTLVWLFHYHPRVLDAWLSKHIESAQRNFRKERTVGEREIYIEVPVLLDGKGIPVLRPADLRPIFAKNRACVLIWGEGGAGKTSLACQIAKWALSGADDGLSSHRMFPALIDEDLSFEVQKDRELLTQTIRGKLWYLSGEPEPPPEELVRYLLRKRRVLVIIDGMSELSDFTRNKIQLGNPEFLANAVIITSRVEEVFTGVDTTIMKPIRVRGNRLSSFMEAYLNRREKRDLFDDPEFFNACSKLSAMVAERDITILMAKLYAEQMIASKETSSQGSSDTNLPESVPNLILSYLNNLNRAAKEPDLDDRTVQQVAKATAWICLSRTFRPTPGKLDLALSFLGGGDTAVKYIKYLEERVRLIETVGPERDRIKFALDPLAEYLAALYLTECNRDNEELWCESLVQFDKAPGAPEAIKEFLLAVRDCCLAKGAELKVPGFVAEELEKRTNRDSEASKREQTVQRIGGGISTLSNVH